jgi:hypothetical protein
VDNIIKSDYFYERCVWALAYCNNPKQTIDYLFNYLGVDKAKSYEVLNAFLVNNYYALDDSARENLYFLVNYLKSIFPKNDFDNIDSKLVDRSFVFMDGFIQQEYEKRFPEFIDSSNSSYLVSTQNNARKNNYESLRAMLYNDMDILVSHSIKFDQRTFELNKVKAYVNDKVKYIGSINSIITDKPSILANDLFLRRANCVMDNMNPDDKGELIQKSYVKLREKLR